MINRFKIVILTILILFAVGGYFITRSYQNSNDSESKESDSSPLNDEEDETEIAYFDSDEEKNETNNEKNDASSEHDGDYSSSSVVLNNPQSTPVSVKGEEGALVDELEITPDEDDNINPDSGSNNTTVNEDKTPITVEEQNEPTAPEETVIVQISTELKDENETPRIPLGEQR